jgi:hypothetical protein
MNSAARVRVTGAVLVLFSAAASFGASARAECPRGASPRIIAELLFGRSIADRPRVSEAAFRRFLDREVTPRFPDGFTLLDTYGQFRNADRGKIVKETGKYLLIALGDEASDLPRVREIAEAYKRRFNQHSVGIITRSSCVSF